MKKDPGFIQFKKEPLLKLLFFKNKKFDRAKALIYMLTKANYKNQTVEIKGQVIHLRRSQLARSIKTLAKDWKCDRKTARRFLKELKEKKIIDYMKCPQEGKTITTIITLYNYDQYIEEPKRDTRNFRKGDTRENEKYRLNRSNILTEGDTIEIEEVDTDYKSISIKDKVINTTSSKGDQPEYTGNTNSFLDNLKKQAEKRSFDFSSEGEANGSI